MNHEEVRRTLNDFIDYHEDIVVGVTQVGRLFVQQKALIDQMRELHARQVAALEARIVKLEGER